MRVEHTPIDGLLVLHLDLHADNRGWFKENWQREKMVAAGLPDFQPVQNNVSFNATRGATRGLHAEPWDKLVSVAAGRVFGAWVDVRAGSATFGETFTLEIDAAVAVFVPYGVANGFQALEDGTAYSYLVNAHWHAGANYTMVNLDLIDWPLPPTEVSAKDMAHPALSAIEPMPARKVLVTGANGQLGRALHRPLAAAGFDAEYATRAEFDITNPPARDWSTYWAIINCAAYNNVNGAEENRAAAWAVNALAPAKLAAIATAHNLTLVHVSTDYIFGNAPAATAWTETDTPAPLNFYGASKAAGEAAATVAPKHYAIRTSWVFGDGNNFVRTMAQLAKRGADPAVIHDQRGRPTFAEDLAGGIVHLLKTKAEYGIYNLSNSGDPVGRDEIAMATFTAMGQDPAAVHPVTTAQYQEMAGPEAPRPQESTLDLSKIEATGFSPMHWRAAIALYTDLYDI
ncbi:dTDP-4-dehydrorhamnose reductase [Corynebacterium phocae]|uniref:dTDP-4-dehydrorhamnose reductase n=1 Tax=Corynebacterium phocae TaxID=161895 RepID=A0A1L7D101_9CORY|nr:bifunctional dTDP-4-dehydrorhamnose 3,5-epimerase family protein/NAD(P)-dependent oxidoreductase [Corynebacterium phocae]APT91774.1 dTDP-4-dehydrorhamnose reductase [Corynebacterium phocae]KAA8728545.1 sugar nucleotide-binding protein [Corynebacterium phocae]